MTQTEADPSQRLDQSTAIANGAVLPYYLADRKLRISIAQVDRRLDAFDDLFPWTDERGPLSGGLLTGTTLICQCHGSLFDITTGAVITGLATEALHVYEVQEVDGNIQIRA
jgi:nitrite reductase/ring-hydroxylating ferredoxin subunit